MGLIALVAIVVYVWVVALVVAATVGSSVRCRAIPLFWVLAVVSAIAMPFALKYPLPVNSGTDYGSFGYFLDGAFSKFNLVCVCGAVASGVIALLPIDTFRVVSAASWGFATALAVRLFRLLSY